MRSFTVATLVILASTSVVMVPVSLCQTTTTLPDCSAYATYKYKPKYGSDVPKEKRVAACKIIVDRSNPGSPLSVTVPHDTLVTVIVDEQQPDEVIQAAITADAVTKADVAGNIAKQLTTPLASFVFSATTSHGGHLSVGPLLLANGIEDRQEIMSEELVTDYKAATQAACLQGYVVFDQATTTCTSIRIPSREAFDKAKTSAATALEKLSTVLPPADLADLDKTVASYCPTRAKGGKML